MDNTIPAWVDGTLTPVDKIEVHLRGLRHKAVSVFVLRGDRLLIQRRALEKYHTPGLWANTCCTHPHWNELPADCAARRLAEELGITGLALSPRGQVEYRAGVGGGMIEHELVDLFVGEAPEGMKIDPNPAEVMEFAWVDLEVLARQTDESPERFTPWLRIYLRKHADQILAR
ncbi:isopentenyl-diphosphate Delta-isomerase [Salipiger abyssi]|uniref:isopentenyl-diphosphate Delta-isomerase n=1 Tax=Salipiger abyssi TaxID=1250539 RepID=UPI001A8F6818|nr:isopentenyl-diphosphate Delta-isomerase [Salipiger abyssi]MBN9886100.1 isopentenyl-diphosphate Delta-isomerase [Salipiger abyssi]